MILTVVSNPTAGAISPRDNGPGGNFVAVADVTWPMRIMLTVLALVALVACQPAVPVPEMTLSGIALAGPYCPVVSDPPDLTCDDRPVIGAEILIRDQAGETVERVSTGEDGRFSIALPAGRYELVPQPVEGLMGTAAAIEVVVTDGQDPGEIVIGYDTGIR